MGFGIPLKVGKRVDVLKVDRCRFHEQVIKCLFHVIGPVLAKQAGKFFGHFSDGRTALASRPTGIIGGSSAEPGELKLSIKKSTTDLSASCCRFLPIEAADEIPDGIRQEERKNNLESS